MSFQLLKAGEVLSKDGWAEHEVTRWYFVCEDEELEWRDGHVCKQLLPHVGAIVRCTVSHAPFLGRAVFLIKHNTYPRSHAGSKAHPKRSRCLVKVWVSMV